MYTIAVCIPTYKRPDMLRKLLLSIFECNINRFLIKNIEIIIIDNDYEKTAENIVNEINDNLRDIFKLTYFNYPIKGLSSVRNELLRKAKDINPNFIVFIDDDEYPTPEWLNELVTTIIVNNGDMARGPVIPVFDNKVKKYLSCWFERQNYQNNTKVKSVAAGNLIINLNSFLKFDIWFDDRFNSTGSEDSYFGEQMIGKGATIYWASNAIVYETIPDDRANLFWLVKRRFRVASTFAYRLKLGNKHILLYKKILVSFFYIIMGFIMMIFILSPTNIKYWGIIKLYEGIGGIVGSLNILHKEYK